LIAFYAFIIFQYTRELEKKTSEEIILYWAKNYEAPPVPNTTIRPIQQNPSFYKNQKTQPGNVNNETSPLLFT
jgi:hypothetical protein